VLAGGDDHRVHFGTRNRGEIVAGVEVRTDFLGELARVLGRLVCHREKAHGGMLRGEPRAQSADAPRADDGESDVARLWHSPLVRGVRTRGAAYHTPRIMLPRGCYCGVAF